MSYSYLSPQPAATANPNWWGRNGASLGYILGQLGSATAPSPQSWQAQTGQLGAQLNQQIAYQKYAEAKKKQYQQAFGVQPVPQTQLAQGAGQGSAIGAGAGQGSAIGAGFGAGLGGGIGSAMGAGLGMASGAANPTPTGQDLLNSMDTFAPTPTPTFKIPQETAYTNALGRILTPDMQRAAEQDAMKGVLTGQEYLNQMNQPPEMKVIGDRPYVRTGATSVAQMSGYQGSQKSQKPVITNVPGIGLINYDPTTGKRDIIFPTPPDSEIINLNGKLMSHNKRTGVITDTGFKEHDYSLVKHAGNEYAIDKNDPAQAQRVGGMPQEATNFGGMPYYEGDNRDVKLAPSYQPPAGESKPMVPGQQIEIKQEILDHYITELRAMNALKPEEAITLRTMINSNDPTQRATAYARIQDLLPVNRREEILALTSKIVSDLQKRGDIEGAIREEYKPGGVLYESANRAKEYRHQVNVQQIPTLVSSYTTWTGKETPDSKLLKETLEKEPDTLQGIIDGKFTIQSLLDDLKKHAPVKK